MTHIHTTRKHCCTQRNKALQDTRKRVALFNCRLAKVHRSCDICGAIQVLATRIDQVNVAPCDTRRCLSSRTVVSHCGMCADSADCFEAESFEVFTLAVWSDNNTIKGKSFAGAVLTYVRPKSGQLFGARQFGDRLRINVPVQPVQIFDKRYSIAHMCSTHSFRFDGILNHLHVIHRTRFQYISSIRNGRQQCLIRIRKKHSGGVVSFQQGRNAIGNVAVLMHGNRTVFAVEMCGQLGVDATGVEQIQLYGLFRDQNVRKENGIVFDVTAAQIQDPYTKESRW